MRIKHKKLKVNDDIRLAAFEKQCELIADAVKFIKTNHNELLTVEEVAKICGMSKCAFLRLSDAGKAPASIKLERLRRWRRLEILAWIADGCPGKHSGNGEVKWGKASKQNKDDSEESYGREY